MPVDSYATADVGKYNEPSAILADPFPRLGVLPASPPSSSPQRIFIFHEALRPVRRLGPADTRTGGYSDRERGLARRDCFVGLGWKVTVTRFYDRRGR